MFSTEAQLFSVRGPPYNEGDIETSLWRHVQGWNRWRGTFFHDMDGRLIAALVLRRLASKLLMQAFYIIIPIVFRLHLCSFIFFYTFVAVCIFYAEAGCNTYY